MNKSNTYRTYTLYIIINSDLDIDEDTLDSDIDIIVSAMIDRIIENLHISINPQKEIYNQYKQWIVDMYDIITLYTSESEIIKLMLEEDYAIIYDENDMKIRPHLLCIFPRTNLDNKMSKFKN